MLGQAEVLVQKMDEMYSTVCLIMIIQELFYVVSDKTKHYQQNMRLPIATEH